MKTSVIHFICATLWEPSACAVITLPAIGRTQYRASIVSGYVDGEANLNTCSVFLWVQKARPKEAIPEWSALLN